MSRRPTRAGLRLFTAIFRNTVRLWNADTGQPIGQPLTGHTDTVRSVAFSPDVHRIVSGSPDSTAPRWTADTGQPVAGHPEQATSVAFSPVGHRVACASLDNT